MDKNINEFNEDMLNVDIYDLLSYINKFHMGSESLLKINIDYLYRRDIYKYLLVKHINDVNDFRLIIATEVTPINDGIHITVYKSHVPGSLIEICSHEVFDTKKHTISELLDTFNMLDDEYMNHANYIKNELFKYLNLYLEYNSSKLQYILFTHNDLDGIGCKILFDLAMESKYDDKYKIKSKSITCSNDLIDNEVCGVLNDNKTSKHKISSNATIYFSDICCSKELLEKLNNKYKVIVLDHHKTNDYADDVLGVKSIVVESKGILECGTSLVYNHFINDLNDYNKIYLNHFVKYVRDYDTFVWKNNGNYKANELSTLLNLLGEFEFVKVYKDNAYKINYDRIIDINHQPFIDNAHEKIDKFIDYHVINELDTEYIHGLKCGYILTSKNINDLSYRYLHEHSDVDIIVKIDLEHGMLGFRSISDKCNLGVDIAAPLGGGGHVRAAGCKIPDDIMKEFINNIFDRINKK